jgi:hypothetical protein
MDRTEKMKTLDVLRTVCVQQIRNDHYQPVTLASSLD